MMVTLSALVFDPSGHVRLDALPRSDVRSLSRRINRAATLDGGVAVNDFGYAPGDRTITLQWRPDRATYDAVARLLRLYGSVRLVMEEGVFLAAPETIRDDAGGSTTMTLLITEQLT